MEVEVWLAALDAPGVPDAARDWLDGPERRRAASLFDERRRRRFVAAHAFLRGLLARRLGCHPAEVEIEATRDDKPLLRGRYAGTLEFSLAHSAELALVALARERPVGVDVERLRELGAAGPRLARRVLTARELEELPANDDRGLLARWVCKEAVLKGSGEGMRRRPATFEVGAPAARPRLVSVPGGDAWTLVSFEPAAGYVGAVAALGDRPLEPRLEAWDWEAATARPA